MKKYRIVPTAQYRKDLKRMIRQHKDLHELEIVIDKLSNGSKLDAKYRDHSLKNGNGVRDCHIEPDWILLYKYGEETISLILMRTGSYAELSL